VGRRQAEAGMQEHPGHWRSVAAYRRAPRHRGVAAAPSWRAPRGPQQAGRVEDRIDGDVGLEVQRNARARARSLARSCNACFLHSARVADAHGMAHSLALTSCLVDKGEVRA
jgi:hypothetical protein